MAETFYPFVEEGSAGSDDVAAPTSPARIAVYDDMTMVPRVVSVEPTDIRSYLEEITKTVFELATQQGGDWSFMLIRELVENFIHASFIEPAISILDKGQTLVFSDQGPGIPNKQAALKPSFSSATSGMKHYIRGVGSGLPIVEEQMKLKHGTITIEDNLGHGTIVTVSLVRHPEDDADNPARRAEGPQPWGQDPRQSPQQTFQQPYLPGHMSQDPTRQPYVQPYAQQPYPAQGYSAQQPYTQQPYPAQQPYAQQPYGQPGAPMWPQQYGQPYGQQPYPAQQPYAQQPYPTQAQGYPAGQAYPVPGQQGQQVWGGQPVGSYAQQGFGGIPNPAAIPAEPSHRAAETSGEKPAGEEGASAGGLWSAIDAHAPLTSKQRDILLLFSSLEQIGPKELNERLGLANATGSRHLQKIAGLGYITRNGQKYMLTAEGQRMLSLLMDSEG